MITRKSYSYKHMIIVLLSFETVALPENLHVWHEHNKFPAITDGLQIRVNPFVDMGTLTSLKSPAKCIHFDP